MGLRPQHLVLGIAGVVFCAGLGSLVPKVIARRKAAPAPAPKPAPVDTGWTNYSPYSSAAPTGEVPVLIALPDFALVDQAGAARTRKDLEGKPSVVDFVFLNCSDVCPRLTARMGSLRGTFAQAGLDARLVTISVDPTNDTPERLAAYAKNVDATPDTWLFLTGPAAEIEKTVVQGFKVATGKEPAPAADGKGEILQIFHGQQLVLVDARARVRGYYDADDAGVARLVADLRTISSRHE